MATKMQIPGRIARMSFSDARLVFRLVDNTDSEHEKETTLKSTGSVHNDLLAAMKGLEEHVLDILELPSTVWKEKMKITGVSWSYSERTDVEGACITGTVQLEGSNSPFCFNTPHLPYAQYAEGGEQPVMSDEAQDALNEVKKEAWAFLNGKRADDLFSQPDKEPRADTQGRLDEPVINADEPAEEVVASPSFMQEAVDFAAAKNGGKHSPEMVQAVGKAHGMPQEIIDKVAKDVGKRGRNAERSR